MGALRAVAIASVSRVGGGGHLPYIGRPEALRLDRIKEERHEAQEMPVVERDAYKRGIAVKELVPGTLPEKETAHEESLSGNDVQSSLHEADAIWSWNTPGYVTGDSFGTQDKISNARRKAQLERGLALAGVTASERPDQRPLALEEKAENARAYFSLLSDSEKRKGGVNSYRLVLTVNGDVRDRDVRGAVNDFLRENFPQAQALVAMHHNTEHIHAHVYVHARQLDGKKVDLKQNYFRLDESWTRICAQQLRDPSIYEDHMRLKSETRRYRSEERVARTGGGTLPDKPERWADRYEILSGVVRPWDDRHVGRLMAAAKVATAKAEYLKLTGGSREQVAEADRETHNLNSKIQVVSAKRALARSESKRALPAEVITIEEQKELTRYASVIREDQVSAGRSVRIVAPHPVQTSFAFEVGHAQQLALSFVSPSKAQSQNKAKNRTALISVPNREEKAQSQSQGKSIATGKDGTNRNSFENSWARPRSVEERKVGDAHAWVLEELQIGVQRELLLRSTEEYAVSLSAQVRAGLLKEHGMSIQMLGYTRETWANIVLLHAQSAFSNAAIDFSSHTFLRGAQSLELMKRSLDQGDDHLLKRLSGPDARSKECELQEGRERDYEQKKKNKFMARGEDLNSHKREGTVEHDLLDKHDKAKIESLDRLEHTFTR